MNDDEEGEINNVLSAIFSQDPQALANCLAGGGNPNATDEDGTSALQFAAHGSGGEAVEMVRLLIAHGADVNHAEPDGSTALQNAAHAGVLSNVSALLEAGATADATNDIGQTALMIAAKFGHLDVVKRLVEHGAKVDAVDQHGRTALHWATTWGDYPEVVRYLLSLGLDPNAKNVVGHTPVDSARAMTFVKALEVLQSALGK